ncbi:alpha/beta fold hydrolase [Nesterenkonia sedimenti]|uniref:alpha/beta fold hydrolase n=1 Tax=Nesterenkonia sedimenti TaxID=1463632 RepID=UPI002D21ABAE|nr:alpha/beta hydrolase [Nesterenkonia sedimenti]
MALRPWGSAFFNLVKDHAEVFTQLPAAVHRGAVEAYIQTASHRGLTPAELEMLVSPWLEAGQSAFYRQIAQADERYTQEVEDRLDAIYEPVHIIWGTEDTWIPADRARRLHELIPHSTLTEVDDAGHIIQLDAPNQLSADLTDWLSRTEHRAGPHEK